MTGTITIDGESMQFWGGNVEPPYVPMVDDGNAGLVADDVTVRELRLELYVPSDGPFIVGEVVPFEIESQGIKATFQGRLVSAFDCGYAPDAYRDSSDMAWHWVKATLLQIVATGPVTYTELALAAKP